MDRKKIKKLKGRGLLPNGEVKIPDAALPKSDPIGPLDVSDDSDQELREKMLNAPTPTGLPFPFDVPEPVPHVTDDWRIRYFGKHTNGIECPVCGSLVFDRAQGSKHLAWHATIAKTTDLPRP